MSPLSRLEPRLKLRGVPPMFGPGCSVWLREWLPAGDLDPLIRRVRVRADTPLGASKEDEPDARSTSRLLVQPHYLRPTTSPYNPATVGRCPRPTRGQRTKLTRPSDAEARLELLGVVCTLRSQVARALRMEQMRRQYLHPPIQEAVCQVSFLDGDWDFVAPSAIYKLLQTQYPEPPGQVIEAGFQVIGPQVEQQIRFGPTPPKTRFSAENGRYLATIGQQVIFVHVVGDYCGWEEFRSRIVEAVDAFVSVTGPSAVTRIGVRYINRITLNGLDFPLERYFTTPPTAPEEGFAGITAFFQRLELKLPDDRGTLVSIFGSAEEEDPKKMAMILDLDAVRTWESDHLPIIDVYKTIDELRDIERNAFESMITDDLRKVFDDD